MKNRRKWEGMAFLVWLAALAILIASFFMVPRDDSALKESTVPIAQSPPACAEEVLARDPRLQDGGVSATCANGIVTLRGTVHTPGQRLVAREAFERVPGVDRVIDQLVVRPVSLPDAEIARGIRAGIPESLRNGTRALEVVVQGGAVQLKGFTASQEQRDVIMDTAMFAPGVASVDNRIEVVRNLPDKQRLTDRWIRETVAATLNSLPVNTLHVHFSVKDGDVTLSGALFEDDDSAQIEDTVRDVAGVASVKNAMACCVRPYGPYPFLYY